LELLALGAPICKEIDIKANEILSRLGQVESTIQTNRVALKELSNVLPVEYRNIAQFHDPSLWFDICTRHQLTQAKDNIFNIWQGCMTAEEEDVIKPSLRRKTKTMGTYEVSAESHYNRMLVEWRNSNIGIYVFEQKGLWDNQKELDKIEAEFKGKSANLIGSASDTHKKLSVEILELSNKRAQIESEIDGLWDVFSDLMQAHFEEPLAKQNLIGRHANPSEWIEALQVKYLYQHKSGEYHKWNDRQYDLRAETWKVLLKKLETLSDEELSIKSN